MTQCNRERLQRLLDESLPEVAEREVAEHVAACPGCQAELESLAAAECWWSEASQRLSKSALARSSHTGSSADDAGSNRSDAAVEQHRQAGMSREAVHDVDADHFAADFAVDFLEPGSDPEMLGRLGDYDIQQVIGRGGMGVVLKGYQKELNRYVAVKVLAPHLASSGAARRRFAREAQATAAIVHPHVMAIHSVNASAKLPYLVMPFVACESLQDRLDRQGPLDVKDVLRIGMQAALGLAAAHAQGLVHRDVKPANILLETTVDRVMLTDFGLARAVDDATLTRTGIIAGTPQYMSPEQANGDAVDHRSDLFSLGSVLYAMCTGRPPFRAETTFGVLRRIREASPRSVREINADIPEWLERCVMRLLSKDAASRIDSAENVASLLERCLAHVQQPTTTPLPGEINDWAPLPVRNVDRKSGWRGAAIGITIVLALMVLVPMALVATWPRSPINLDGNVNANHAAPVVEPEAPDSSLQWNTMETEFQSISKAIEPLEENAQRDLKSLATDSTESLEPTDSNRQE